MNILPIRNLRTKFVLAAILPIAGILLSGLSGCSTHDHGVNTNDPTIIYKTRGHLSPIKVNQRQIISTHNKFRAKYGLKRLSWSNELASYSQEWANTLKNNNACRMRHRPNNPYGENLSWASPVSWSDGKRSIQQLSSADVVNGWGNEDKFYNYQRNSCQQGQQCGHYTQMVWKDTTQVGCAVAICQDFSQVWVCNYNPPGNYIGKRPY
ncbi:MAG: SCP-like extracellular [uncultured Thiotrichaceae bacterium]|uniref:SCP-like extracellular n=1 Tax=uncultured Thiotrichaceae bacterium TaxID=298394 RepID=A0A6S6TT09_9GAMM|nr:MAG: SCP-like extracellular [uncultured Thiotrichaceae bacterium]